MKTIKLKTCSCGGFGIITYVSESPRLRKWSVHCSNGIRCGLDCDNEFASISKAAVFWNANCKKRHKPLTPRYNPDYISFWTTTFPNLDKAQQKDIGIQICRQLGLPPSKSAPVIDFATWQSYMKDMYSHAGIPFTT